MNEERQWIIQRCMHRWKGTELIYEDRPTPRTPMLNSTSD